VEVKKVNPQEREPIYLSLQSSWQKEETLKSLQFRLEKLMKRTGASEELSRKGFL